VTMQIIFSLPEVISAELDVLGRVDPLNINGLIGTVHTPNDCTWGTLKYWQDMEWEDIDDVPDLEKPTELVPELPETAIDWGWVTSSPEYGVEINSLLLSLDSSIRSLDADIYSWFGNVANWLQAYTLQVLAPQSADEKLVSRSIRAWRIVDGEADEIVWLRPMTSNKFPEWTLVTVPIWTASLRLASSGDELPLNWQLLVDSLRALYASYPRRAAIEAFTALEVTLREAIRQRLDQSGDSSAAKVIQKQRRTLGPLIELAADLEVPLPDGFTASIAELRNNAVHKGDLPSQNDALMVWQAAYALVQLHDPLPTL
jgi:hypothetical protein